MSIRFDARDAAFGEAWVFDAILRAHEMVGGKLYGSQTDGGMYEIHVGREGGPFYVGKTKEEAAKAMLHETVRLMK